MTLEMRIMNVRVILVAVVLITLGTTIVAAPLLQELRAGKVSFRGGDEPVDPVEWRKAQPAITGENVYTVWGTNETGSEEVMFRASTDGGASFGDQINLSNTTDADSTRAEIDSDANSVVVTWWETNQTDDTPVMRVSEDNGETFGPLLRLATNGTLDVESG
jgi:hypothetical protein